MKSLEWTGEFGVSWKTFRAFITRRSAGWRICSPLFYSCCCRFCKIPLAYTNLNSSCDPVFLCFLPSLTSFCSLFIECTLMLSCIPCSPSLAVPLTYFVLHCQRQEECLPLCVLSRSVGQRRRTCAFFPPSFVSRSPSLHVLMKTLQQGVCVRIWAFFPYCLVLRDGCVQYSFIQDIKL